MAECALRGQIIELVDGYDRNKNKRKLKFRRATEEDIGTIIHPGARVWAVANNGTAKQVTIASEIKRWKKPSKTRDYTIEFSIKYGLWEWDKFRNCNCDDDAISRL